ncbi:MAG: hypothetical protein QOJ14_1120, partial [Thermoleophilaceae bacterium]|nr:hypothetical protein [Thermoleophilaceae bacterium]
MHVVTQVIAAASSSGVTDSGL